jgi:D-3-phosphoglycerate dehydrogenase
VKTVLLTQDIVPVARELLEKHTRVEVAPSADDGTVRGQIAGVAGLVVRSATNLSRRTIMAADALEVIARTGAGVDNVDLDAATERGIPVCHTPEANKLSVAEHALALILALGKDLPRLDRETRAGNWAVRDSSRAFELQGKTLGIVGLGRVGREVAARAEAFGMKVIAHDPFVDAAPGGSEVELVAQIGEVFERAQVVTLHVPLTEETRGLVDAGLLAKMQAGSILVNTSRGAVVDQAALVEALRSGTPAAAALDVFEEEPLPAASPLCEMPNVILTPHAAALTRECKARMALDCVRGLVDVLEGRRPRWVANRDALRERGVKV